MKSLRLLFIHGERKGEEFMLSESEPLSLGRTDSNDIILHDKKVSRKHCTFFFENGCFKVVDNDSKRGILLNEEKKKCSEIKPGDIIRIRETVIQITDVGAQEERSARQRIIRITHDPDREYHPDGTVDRFLKNNRSESAIKVITGYQITWYVFVALCFFLLLNFDWLYFLTVVNFIFATFYIISILYKLFTVLLSYKKRSEVVIEKEEYESIKKKDFPVYTILVPLYHEREVSKKIIDAIGKIDYPQDKLDVKLILEADDSETLEKCEEGLPDFCEILIVPDIQPKTKPRACNHGLEHARGTYLVIYDAEDRPDPDQLKKAVVAFKKYPEIPCFQSKLNYYNQHQNFLTKWFTVEYTAWFDLFLPGLHMQKAPIPLGGTSNHFRTDVLREVGGWDPFNVTEDADLGIRLYKRGYRTYILDSTTWEEANSRLYNWIRQRSRWIKGYIQTHLVHMRNPFSTFSKLGPLGFFSFLFTVGGMALMMLLNPIYWCIVLLYGFLVITDMIAGKGLGEIVSAPGIGEGLDVLQRKGFHAWQMVFVSESDASFWSAISVIFFTVSIVLLISNFVFILLNFIAAKRRNLKGMLLNNVLSPLYWGLISISAWKGLIQLFYKPFYWEKTVHGYFDE